MSNPSYRGFIHHTPNPLFSLHVAPLLSFSHNDHQHHFRHRTRNELPNPCAPSKSAYPQLTQSRFCFPSLSRKLPMPPPVLPLVWESLASHSLTLTPSGRANPLDRPPPTTQHHNHPPNSQRPHFETSFFNPHAHLQLFCFRTGPTTKRKSSTCVSITSSFPGGADKRRGEQEK